MDEIDPTAAQKINQIVAAAGEEHLAAYIKQKFPPPLVAPGCYTVENAVNWLDFDKFMRWLSHAIQTTAASASINTNAFPGSPSILSHPTCSSPSTVHSPPRSNAVDMTDSPPPAPLLRHQKRKRQPEDVICITSDSESDSHIQSTSTKKRAKRNKRSKSDGRVVISKQLSCSEIRTITKIPSCWTVPHPEDGDFAYLLDISEDQMEWLNKKNEPLSMIAIIKTKTPGARVLPFLAGRIHSAKASLHDNTYARVHGVWKEWEVVIWDDKLDFRATITRIYSTRETYEVFGKMWPALWDTIHRVTGVEVKFKFIHGGGLRTVLVDGNKPQANTFGADLIARNKPHLSAVHVTDPQAILPFILRTCVFHVNRKFAAMALADELDEFIEWCKNSEHKVVRDWIKDKDSVRDWFWSSINEFLSEIPKEDWYLTPGDTNLNESAHPYTNQHTGTNLPLLEAIQRAYQLDLQVEEKIKLMEEQCVLINHRSSKGHRDRNNASRRSANHHKALDRSHAREEIEGIDAQVKALKEKKKALQTTSGIKKTKKQGEREDSSDEAGHGLAPIPAAYTEQAAFLAAPMLSNFGFQLDPALEPSFPPGAGYENLDGNLEDYMYPF
ncbi:hypothetical protein DFH09DRAFT_1363963 [Mycena vulgaris]|nr:hypothetical protein DFH09DRAFT_1363963 [Mycena vulgaris]